MSKQIQYYVEKVVHTGNNALVFSSNSIKDAIGKIKELNIGSKDDNWKEFQWFPYVRLIAVKPSGSIKNLKFNLVKLN